MTDGMGRDAAWHDPVASGAIDHGAVGRAFPAVEARSLSGRRVWLLEDFGGGPNPVQIGFEVWHRVDLDSWLPTLDAVAGRCPGLRVYEFVPIPRVLLPARPTIHVGMAIEIVGAAGGAREGGPASSKVNRGEDLDGGQAAEVAMGGMVG